MKPLLALERAAFGYGGRDVLSDLTLSVEAGAFVGIVGPNGSGKTTLFRALSGLVKPSRGRVERNARAIGYVPQRETLDALYPLTVGEVVEMGCTQRLRGWRSISREERARAEHMIQRVGLANESRSAFSSLSGGQRQRALVARALLVEPDVLLLDEPTSGVDRSAARELMQLLREFHERDGIAVLLVSHQPALVRELAKEAWWVSDGHVVRGPAEELLSPRGLDRLFGAAREETP